MKLYTPDGWLDVKHIEEVADKNDIAFIIMIGKRQVGKTYGVLKLMLDEDKRFIFMRRVKVELEMLEKNVNSPFEKIHGYEGRVLFSKESDYTANIERIDQTEEGDQFTRIATGCSLSSIGNIRGFNGDLYSDWVFDEFIPEEQLFKVRNEEDAFLNAHTTINGNRELEGRPPVRTWLLSNSNNLSSGILDALKVTKDIEKMSLRGEESRILKDRGIMILLPESRQVIEKRKKGALYKAIGGDSKFSRMAYNNEFAYNDYTDVSSKPLSEYNPLVTIGRITIHLHKNDKTLYVTDKVKAKARYILTDSETHINKFNRNFTDVKVAYLNNRMYFQDMRIKNYFLNLLK